jgi:hypothetical protein
VRHLAKIGDVQGRPQTVTTVGFSVCVTLYSPYNRGTEKFIKENISDHFDEMKRDDRYGTKQLTKKRGREAK